MSEWKRIITTRKSSLAAGLAWSLCSTNYIQQGIEKSQQAVAQLVQIPRRQNITKNLPNEFRSSLPGIEEIEAELRYFLLSSGWKNHREHRVHGEKLHCSVLSVYSVVEKLYSNSLFQEKLKSLGIKWR